jgi:hypothetical protein
MDLAYLAAIAVFAALIVSLAYGCGKLGGRK